LRACIHRDECACVVSVSDILCNSKKKELERNFKVTPHRGKDNVSLKATGFVYWIFTNTIPMHTALYTGGQYSYAMIYRENSRLIITSKYGRLA
jgi:hypothetical protein